MTTPAPTTELEVDLGEDLVAIVSITVIVPGLPAPLERPTLREPTVHELDRIAAALSNRTWKRKP
jgi:hypothetical protein